MKIYHRSYLPIFLFFSLGSLGSLGSPCFIFSLVVWAFCTLVGIVYHFSAQEPSLKTGSLRRYCCSRPQDHRGDCSLGLAAECPTGRRDLASIFTLPMGWTRLHASEWLVGDWRRAAAKHGCFYRRGKRINLLWSWWLSMLWFDVRFVLCRNVPPPPSTLCDHRRHPAKITS